MWKQCPCKQVADCRGRIRRGEETWCEQEAAQLERRASTVHVGGASSLRIVQYLAEHGEGYAAQMEQELGIPRGTIFYAVSKMQRAGWVRTERVPGASVRVPGRYVWQGMGEANR